MAIYVPEAPAIWMPPKPAVMRSASDLTSPGLPGLLVGGVLPGIGMPIGGLAGALSAAFFNLSVSSAQTVALPANCQVGMFAIMAWRAGNPVSSTPSDVAAPSGWSTHQTQVQNHNGITLEGCRGKLMSHVLDATDISTGTFTGFDGANWDDKIILVFEGNRPFTSAAYTAGGGQITAANPSSQTANASGASSAPVIVAGFAGSNNTTAAFSTASPAFDGTVLTGNSDMIGGYKIYNSAPQDHSIDMNDLTSANWLASGYWTLT